MMIIESLLNFGMVKTSADMEHLKNYKVHSHTREDRKEAYCWRGTILSHGI